VSATCTAATICPQIHTTGHTKTKKAEPQFLRCWRYLRMLHCPNVRIAIVLATDDFPPHLMKASRFCRLQHITSHAPSVR